MSGEKHSQARQQRERQLFSERWIMDERLPGVEMELAEEKKNQRAVEDAV